MLSKKNNSIKSILTILLLFTIVFTIMLGKIITDKKSVANNYKFKKKDAKVSTLNQKYLNNKRKRKEILEEKKKENIFATQIDDYKNKPLYFRIIKSEKILQMFYFERESSKFRHAKNYSINIHSDKIGPKSSEYDDYSPEGFYYIKHSDLLGQKYDTHNYLPIGKTNKLDKKRGWSDELLKIHTNDSKLRNKDKDETKYFSLKHDDLLEVRKLIFSSFYSGNLLVKFHIFPFKMSEQAVENKKDSEWYAFWENMKEGYKYFENKEVPPNTWISSDNRYMFSNSNLPY